MARYPAYRTRRASSGASWNRVGCVITAEDGTFGVGVTINGGPVVKVINDHFARHLVGENCMATEKVFDMMFRMATPYGSTGLASYAISAVDLALWDLKGKLLNRPVYELLGGLRRKASSVTLQASRPNGTWSWGSRRPNSRCPMDPPMDGRAQQK